MQKNKTVLLTRSVAENYQLRRKLEKYRIFSSINCPLISFKGTDFDQNILESYENIIITSKYAAKILNKIIKTPVQAFVVGKATAAALKEPVAVEYIAGNVEELIGRLLRHPGFISGSQEVGTRHPELVLGSYEMPNQVQHDVHGNDNSFLYLSSNEITEEFPPTIKRQIIYEVKYSEKLSEQQIKTISQGLDYILLYSHNCAKTMVKLLIKYDLLTKLAKTRVIAVSSKVANVVKPYFKAVIFPSNNGLYNKTLNDKVIELLITDAEIRK